MSTYYTLISSTFRVNSSDWGLMRNLSQKTLSDYDDSVDFKVESEHEGSIVFTISFDGEAGDSFPRRIGKLMQEIGPFLQEAGTITMREDTFADERDQKFYGGPSREAVWLAKFKDHLLVAQQELLLTLPHGDDDRTPAMSAVTGVAHGLVRALSLIEKSIDVEREARGGNAPAELLDSKADKLANAPATKQDQFIQVDTAWGEINLPYGAQFQLGLDGSVLVAASTREDGDADVLGSLNLQPFEDRGASREDTCAALTRFVVSHPVADLFRIVDTVPDVLTLNDKHWLTDEDTDSTAAPILQN